MLALGNAGEDEELNEDGEDEESEGAHLVSYLVVSFLVLYRWSPGCSSAHVRGIGGGSARLELPLQVHHAAVDTAQVDAKGKRRELPDEHDREHHPLARSGSKRIKMRNLLEHFFELHPRVLEPPLSATRSDQHIVLRDSA